MTDAANGNWTPDRPIVSLKDVHKSFGDLEVLKGISFDVMKGEVICIIGPSGSGKSTLIRCVNALNPIDSGSIAVEGQEVNDPKLNKLELRKKVGMVFQQYNLFPAQDGAGKCHDGACAGAQGGQGKRRSAGEGSDPQGPPGRQGRQLPRRAFRRPSNSASPSPARSPCSRTSCCSTR